MKRRIHVNGRLRRTCLDSRSQDLRVGRLHDITATARVCARLDIPAAISHRLWKTLAPGEPFRADDERIREVCYALGFARVGAIPGQVLDMVGGQALRFAFLRGDRDLHLTAWVHLAQDRIPACTIMLTDEE